MKRLIGAAAVLFSVLPGAMAQTVEVCKQVTQAINHPAQFAIEKTQRCLMKKERKLHKRIWRTVMVAANPVCCSPAWPAHPVCYVANNKKVKDAWTETKSTLKCDPRDVRDGVKEFLQWHFDPRYVVFKDLKPIADAGAAILLAVRNEKGKPLPEAVKRYLKAYRAELNLPFADRDVDNARWVSSDETVVKPFTPINAKSHDSITWDALIIAGPALRASAGCDQLEDWAHEVVHVRQYRERGVERFLTEYTQQVGAHGYEGAPFEKEAYATGTAVLDHCKRKGHGRDIPAIK